jgi:hypothetical protein
MQLRNKPGPGSVLSENPLSMADWSVPACA